MDGCLGYSVQVDCLLQTVGEMLSAAGSARFGTHDP